MLDLQSSSTELLYYHIIVLIDSNADVLLVTGSGIRGVKYPYPQQSSLSASLLERQLELLGSLLAVVGDAALVSGSPERQLRLKKVLRSRYG